MPAQHTALIVNADPTLAQVISAVLKVGGVQPIVTADGEKALVLARSLQPDLVLLEMDIENRSGIEVCATLKTDPETASLPVVFLTARKSDTDRQLGLAAGADAYLTIPFSPAYLVDFVTALIAGTTSDLLPRQAVSDSTDQLMLFAAEWRDLFQRERAERRSLEQAQKCLEELDRLKADFLSVVTHELLTPFASIGVTLQVVQHYAADASPELRQALDDLTSEIANLHRLINGVVKFAELVTKQRDPQPGYIAVSRLIPAAVQPAAVLALARDVDFRVFVPDDLPRVYVDPELLSEAVFQMAHNAVKFNVPGGKAQVRAFESQGWLVIQVSDTGIGLTPQQLELLGQPFEQNADALRRGREGLGVGWAFVCYVAEAHGGRTTVESPGPGKGSTFSLYLPAVAGWHAVVRTTPTDGKGG